MTLKQLTKTWNLKTSLRKCKICKTSTWPTWISIQPHPLKTSRLANLSMLHQFHQEAMLPIFHALSSWIRTSCNRRRSKRRKYRSTIIISLKTPSPIKNVLPPPSQFLRAFQLINWLIWNCKRRRNFRKRFVMRRLILRKIRLLSIDKKIKQIRLNWSPCFLNSTLKRIHAKGNSQWISKCNKTIRHNMKPNRTIAMRTYF